MFRSTVTSKKFEISDLDGGFDMADLYGDDIIATTNLKDVNGAKGIDKLRNYDTKRQSFTFRRSSLTSGQASLRNSPRQLIDESVPSPNRESLSTSNSRYSLAMKLYSSPKRSSIIPVAQAEAVLVSIREGNNESSGPVNDSSTKYSNREVVHAEPILEDDYDSNADSRSGILLQGAGSRLESNIINHSGISSIRLSNTPTTSSPAISDLVYRSGRSGSANGTASTSSPSSSNASSPPNSINQTVPETRPKTSVAPYSAFRPGFTPAPNTADSSNVWRPPSTRIETITSSAPTSNSTFSRPVSQSIGNSSPAGNRVSVGKSSKSLALSLTQGRMYSASIATSTTTSTLVNQSATNPPNYKHTSSVAKLFGSANSDAHDSIPFSNFITSASSSNKPTLSAQIIISDSIAAPTSVQPTSPTQIIINNSKTALPSNNSTLLTTQLTIDDANSYSTSNNSNQSTLQTMNGAYVTPSSIKSKSTAPPTVNESNSTPTSINSTPFTPITIEGKSSTLSPNNSIVTFQSKMSKTSSPSPTPTWANGDILKSVSSTPKTAANAATTTPITNSSSKQPSWVKGTTNNGYKSSAGALTSTLPSTPISSTPTFTTTPAVASWSRASLRTVTPSTISTGVEISTSPLSPTAVSYVTSSSSGSNIIRPDQPISSNSSSSSSRSSVRPMAPHVRPEAPTTVVKEPSWVRKDVNPSATKSSTVSVLTSVSTSIVSPLIKPPSNLSSTSKSPSWANVSLKPVKTQELSNASSALAISPIAVEKQGKSTISTVKVSSVATPRNFESMSLSSEIKTNLAEVPLSESSTVHKPATESLNCSSAALVPAISDQDAILCAIENINALARIPTADETNPIQNISSAATTTFEIISIGSFTTSTSTLATAPLTFNENLAPTSFADLKNLAATTMLKGALSEANLRAKKDREYLENQNDLVKLSPKSSSYPEVEVLKSTPISKRAVIAKGQRKLPTRKLLNLNHCEATHSNVTIPSTLDIESDCTDGDTDATTSADIGNSETDGNDNNDYNENVLTIPELAAFNDT